MLKRIVLPFLLFALTMGYSVCSANEAATEAETAVVRAPLDFPGMVFVKDTVGSKYLPSTAAYHIMLDGPQPALDPTTHPFGRYLLYSAQLYSLASGRTSFTVTDLLEAGYWPYTNGLSEADLQLGLVAHSSMPLLREGSEITELTGTAEWILWQKQTLASFYYSQVRSNPAFDPAELVPVEQFWLNPLHGRTAQIGPNRGDIELVDLGRFLTRAQKKLPGHSEKLVRMFRLSQESELGQ